MLIKVLFINCRLQIPQFTQPGVCLFLYSFGRSFGRPRVLSPLARGRRPLWLNGGAGWKCRDKEFPARGENSDEAVRGRGGSMYIHFMAKCGMVWRQYSRYVCEEVRKGKIHSFAVKKFFHNAIIVRTSKTTPTDGCLYKEKRESIGYSHETKLAAFRSWASSGEYSSTIRFNCIAFSLGPLKLEMGAVGSLLSWQRVLPAASSS